MSLTQEQLGERSGLSREHISYIENGHREPCLVNMVKLAKAFGITLAEMLEGI
jgi:transcriptional regulator with XRE-family HTH domain